jgi:hypothetical protein
MEMVFSFLLSSGRYLGYGMVMIWAGG